MLTTTRDPTLTPQILLNLSYADFRLSQLDDVHSVGQYGDVTIWRPVAGSGHSDPDWPNSPPAQAHHQHSSRFSCVNWNRAASIMPDLIPRIHLYPPFREIDTISYAMQTGLLGLGAGTFSACMKAAYFSTSASPWSVVSVYGGTIPVYGTPMTRNAHINCSCYAWNVRFYQSLLPEFPTRDRWMERVCGRCFCRPGLGRTPYYPFLREFLISGRRSLVNIVAVAVFAGTSLGIFSWAGGLGGFSSISGVDIHKALQYRRDFRFYPTGLMPLEDYERAIGRKAHPEDFADIDACLGTDRFDKIATPTDVVGYIPVKKPDQQWWKDVLEKTGRKEEESKK